jgi:two-component system phosphate regulon sensor histidine kinase PhoR
MRRSLLAVSLRGYALVILVMAILALILILGGLKPVITELALQDLSRTALVLRGALSPWDPDSMGGHADSLRAVLGGRPDLRITLVAPDGTVLLDTETESTGMESHRTRPEILAALSGGTGTDIRWSETLGREMLYAAVPVMSNGDLSFVLRVSIPFTHLGSVMGATTSRMAVLALVALLLSGLVAWLSSRSIAVPVRRLSEEMSLVRDGDFSVRVEPSSITELDELSKSFNETAARTGDLIEEISQRNSQFRAILESSAGPLAVLDTDGCFVFANGAFRALCSDPSIESRDYREVISSADLMGLLREALGARSGNRDSVNVLGRTWTVRFTTVPGHDQVVVGMADITEAAAVATMKRDFAVNVSHELRTPLTAIKGFAETLAEHASPADRKYFDTILRNTERLISLVRDVQTLAEIEAPGYEPEMEELDLVALVGLVLDLFRPRAEERGLELIFTHGNLPAVKGDAYRLQQVVINLLDNAIKYTERGSVAVSLEVREGSAVLEVGDTGQGIPPADIPRLCERFYVVDRSRSRRSGGTGLGLSIVKHIVMMHGGTLEIRSEQGTGSTFSVRLPLPPVS